MAKVLVICLFLSSLSSLAFSSDTMEIVDDVVTWGAGISGGVSLTLCSEVKGTTPFPVSYYTFNSAMVTYWAMDLLISDEDKKSSEEVVSSEQNGQNDEQYNSYVRARDLAIVNKEAALKKGKYKQAAVVVMLASAVLALNEGSQHEVESALSMKSVKASCISATTSGDGVNASNVLKNGRCKNIGGGKVTCSDVEKNSIKRQQQECNRLADYIKMEPKTGCSLFNSNFEKLSKTGEDNSNALDFSKMTTDKNLKEVYNNSVLGKKINFRNNPVTSAMTLGGLQFEPTTRALTYGALGAVVGINSLANNSAAKKFEEEEKLYQGLIDEIENCSNNCNSENSSTSDSSGDERISIDNTNTDLDDSPFKHREDARYHRRYEKNDLTVWYLDKKLDQYPTDLKVVIIGCGEITISNNNGVRHENGSVTLKNSEVPGRGTAIISNKTCTSKEAYALY